MQPIGIDLFTARLVERCIDFFVHLCIRDWRRSFFEFSTYLSTQVVHYSEVAILLRPRGLICIAATSAHTLPFVHSPLIPVAPLLPNSADSDVSGPDRF